MLASYLKPDLLIIDDMGMKQLPKRSGEYLFEIVMRRYETRSTMMTSNRPLEDWGKLLGDVPTRDGDPRPVPAPRRDRPDHRPELPACGTGRARHRTLRDSKPAKRPPARRAARRVQNQPKHPPAPERLGGDSLSHPGAIPEARRGDEPRHQRPSHGEERVSRPSPDSLNSEPGRVGSTKVSEISRKCGWF